MSVVLFGVALFVYMLLCVAVSVVRVGCCVYVCIALWVAVCCVCFCVYVARVYVQT